MRRYNPLRPRAYSESVQSSVRDAAASGEMLDVGAEAGRIARESGISAAIVARDLIQTGIDARIHLEFPRVAALDGHALHTGLQRRTRRPHAGTGPLGIA